MEVVKIAALLGRASTDPDVVQTLATFGIDDQPHVKVDENDVDGPVVGTDDWLLNGVAGVEFGFEDQAAFYGLEDSEQGRGPMLLTQIYFYVNHDHVKPYVRALPCGLRHNDGRDAVRSRLHEHENQRRSYRRDAWALGPFTLIVSYTADFSAIDCVLCVLPRPALPPLEQQRVVLPALTSIIALFGRSRRDPELRALFVPFGLDREAEYLQSPQLADFRKAYGFELEFSEADQSFSGIALFRERMRDARGWSGELPLGLYFDDSPEIVLRKIGIEASDRFDDDLSGWMLWHFRGCSVRVHYSSVDNVILDVRISAAKWEAAALASATPEK